MVLLVVVLVTLVHPHEGAGIEMFLEVTLFDLLVQLQFQDQFLLVAFVTLAHWQEVALAPHGEVQLDVVLV